MPCFIVHVKIERIISRERTGCAIVGDEYKLVSGCSMVYDAVNENIIECLFQIDEV